MIAIIFILPIVQMLILGYVISSKVQNIETVICDLDNSRESRELISSLNESGYFILERYSRDYHELETLIDRGEVATALVIPQSFSKKLRTGQAVAVQVLLDGQDVNTATITLGYIQGIVRSFARQQMASLAIETRGVPVPVREVSGVRRDWFNPDLEYSDYMVPGIAAFLLTIVTSLLSAMGLVREREIGTLEQLSVTPIRKHQLLIGKIIPFAILGFLELTVALVFAKFWYDIPIRGNLIIFALFTVIYLFTTLGLGLLVSASSHTQQQALFLVWFLMVFGILMSGFLFPIENMPETVQLITYLNPLRYFIVVIRELFIKGVGLEYLYPQGAALVLFGAAVFSVAVVKYQQRLK
jgi:ABC-2 type transport system permease protein